MSDNFIKCSNSARSFSSYKCSMTSECHDMITQFMNFQFNCNNINNIIVLYLYLG